MLNVDRQTRYQGDALHGTSGNGKQDHDQGECINKDY
jgi:hypothetical protein